MACSAATGTARQPDFARHQGQIGHRGRQIQLESRLDPCRSSGTGGCPAGPAAPADALPPPVALDTRRRHRSARGRPQARNPRRPHHRRQPRPQDPRLRPVPGAHNRGLRPQLHLRHRGSRRRSRLASPHPSNGPGQRRLPRPPGIVPPPPLPRRPKPGRVGHAPPSSPPITRTAPASRPPAPSSPPPPTHLPDQQEC